MLTIYGERDRLFLDARKYIQQMMQNVPSTDFHGLFPTLSESGNSTSLSSNPCRNSFNMSFVLGIDFLKGLLRFDPEKRSTVEEALGNFCCCQLIVFLPQSNSFRPSVFEWKSARSIRTNRTAYSRHPYVC